MYKLIKASRHSTEAAQKASQTLKYGCDTRETSSIRPTVLPGDAAAARPADELRQLFSDVEIQPTGLLATECVVSFPLVSSGAPALAIHSHFFEFQKIAADGEATGGYRLAHELDLGSRYVVIVTTGGGLYRYQLGDIVEVAGYANECPLIRFMGRANQTSDLVGEKLSEPFVRGHNIGTGII